MVDISEGRWVGPWKSQMLEDTVEIKNFQTGSKIVFFRNSSSTGCLVDSYAHIGILLNINGEAFVVETQKREDKTSAMINKFTNIFDADLGHEAKIDNMYLISTNVDINSFLYRLSRIVNAPIEYDVSRLNCDVIGTWLTTGNTEWVTMVRMTCLCTAVSNICQYLHFRLLGQDANAIKIQDLRKEEKVVHGSTRNV